jgi:hypothetical protein
MFSQTSDYVRVKEIVTPGGTHPTAGWYVEGTLVSPDSTRNAFVWATCIDFPAISAEWTGAFGNHTYAMTTGSDGAKFCGLQGIYGAFSANNYASGAFLNAPATQTGNWTMTVTAGKYAEADCIQ